MITFFRAALCGSVANLTLTLLASALIADGTATAQTSRTNAAGQKSTTRQVAPTTPKAAAPKSPTPAAKPQPTNTPATKTAEPAKPAATTKPATEPAAVEKDDKATEPKPASTVKEEPVEVDGKYLFRYKFQKGETLRWDVEHKAEVRTSVANSTQTAETTTTSVKSWRVTILEDNGNAKFIHSVDRVDMRNKLTGRQEVTYNSVTDKQPPEGFEQMAKEIGVPLTLVLVDNRGTVLRREDLVSQPNSRTGQIIVPLPEQRVAVGDVWNIPLDVSVTLKNKTVKQVKTRQQFKLQSVNNDIATLQVESQILTPIHDPQLEAQLMQYDFNGTIRFDIKAGRIVAQQCDLDKRVHGFQGEASTMHYVTRFIERLQPANLNSATRPTVVGPQPK